MKTFLTANLLAAATFFISGFTALAQAGDPQGKALKLVPYKDKVTATVTQAEQNGDVVRLTFEANGAATKLGKMTTLGFIDLNTLDFTFTGENTLTSANGDQIFLTIIGLLTPTQDEGVYHIRLRTVFESGTGRFENVRGGFFGEGLLQSTPNFVGSTFKGKGFGAITVPDKKKAK